MRGCSAALRWPRPRQGTREDIGRKRVPSQPTSISAGDARCVGGWTRLCLHLAAAADATDPVQDLDAIPDRASEEERAVLELVEPWGNLSDPAEGSVVGGGVVAGHDVESATEFVVPH